MDGVYTNKPPGGVAYRCSFRVTEAVHTIERMVDIAAHELGQDPADFRFNNFIQPEQFPYTVTDGMGVRLGQLPGRPSQGDGHDRLRGLAPGAGREARPRRADGHRHLVIHGDRRRRALEHLRHPGHQDVRFVRDPSPSDRQGHGPHRRPDPGPGPRDDLRPDHRRGARLSGRRHRHRVRRYRHGAVRPGHLRQPLDAGRRRRHGHGLAQDPRQGQAPGRPSPGGQRGRPGMDERRLQCQGLTRPEEDDPGDRLRRLHQPSAGHGGRAWRRSTTTTRRT